jgi:hypothetical protein
MGVGTCENGIVRAHGAAAAAAGPIVNFDTARVPHHIELRDASEQGHSAYVFYQSPSEARRSCSRRRAAGVVVVAASWGDETASNLILINPSLKTLTNSFCRRRRSHCYC